MKYYALYLILIIFMMTNGVPALFGEEPQPNLEGRFEGYILDKACNIAGQGMDGSNILRRPQDHTQHCIAICAKSGLGLTIKQGKTYNFVPFDKKGDELANKIVRTTKREKGLFVIVNGTMKEGTLHVSSIREADPEVSAR